MSSESLMSLTQNEELILSLLTSRSKAYGLELVKESGGSLKRGTIYVTLNRMEDKGFIESWLEDTKEGQLGPPRRQYKVTAKGARAFDGWQIYKTFMQNATLPGKLI